MKETLSYFPSLEKEEGAEIQFEWLVIVSSCISLLSLFSTQSLLVSSLQIQFQLTQGLS